MFGGAEAAVERVRDALTCAVRDVLDRLDVVRDATRGQARTLAYQFGVPPMAAGERTAPRSLAALPTIHEGEVVEQTRLPLDESGRVPSAGFYANIGDSPFQVVLIGADGASSSAAHTLIPGSTISINCFVSAVLVLPLDGQAARFQVYAQ